MIFFKFDGNISNNKYALLSSLLLYLLLSSLFSWSFFLLSLYEYSKEKECDKDFSFH